MRDDLKNFEITTEQMIEYSSKDFFNNSLSEEQLNKIWQEEYTKRLEGKLTEQTEAELELEQKEVEKILEEEKQREGLFRRLFKEAPVGFLALPFWLGMGWLAVMFLLLFLSLLMMGIGVYEDGPVSKAEKDYFFYFTLFISSPIGFWLFKRAVETQLKIEITGLIRSKKLNVLETEAKKETDNYIAQYKEKYAKDHSPPKALSALIAEVRKYNAVTEELVYNIHVIDQLQEAGEAVKIKDRDNVLGAFRTMRNDLIRALKVERILRENPRFKPELFSINFAPLEDLKLSQQVANCEQLVNDALNIGIRVQETMRNFARDILK